MIFVQFMWGLCGLQKLNFPLKMSFSSYADFLVRHFENIKPTFEWFWSKKLIKIVSISILINFCFVFFAKTVENFKIYTVFAKKRSEILIKIKIDPILINFSLCFFAKTVENFKIYSFCEKTKRNINQNWNWLVFD